MKIVCIGRNYAEHAAELGNAVPDEPLFFIKPDTALLRNNNPFVIPTFTKDVHYEVEMVLKIDKIGKCIPVQFAHEYYREIALGVDFTARDIQQQCKEKGLPWEKAKGFDYSAVISDFVSKDKFDLRNLNFSISKNGEVKQQGNTNQMIHFFDSIIAEASKYFTLKIGDYIYTGTPAGVGPVANGDFIEGYIENQKMFGFKVMG